LVGKITFVYPSPKMKANMAILVETPIRLTRGTKIGIIKTALAEADPMKN
jgi:hypothetical protein